MGLRISTNVSSINARRSLDLSQREIQKSFAQLSSGERITKSADDAAGLAVSENLKSQIRGYRQAQRNALDATSLVQVSEGGLGEISNILTRLRELGVQAATDTVGDQERGFINKEVQQLTKEAERIALSTKFGSIQLLDGKGKSFDFQVDINNDDFRDRISFNSADQDATTEKLGIKSLDFTQKKGAQDALMVVDKAQNMVSEYRANLGSIQNRLLSTSNNLGVAEENLSAANSRIRDTDVAASTAELSRNSVLLQASSAILSQANTYGGNAALKLIG